MAKKHKHQWKRIETSLYGVICENCGKQVEDIRLLKSKKELIENIKLEEGLSNTRQEDSRKLLEKLNLEIEINKRLMKYIREFRD